MNKTNLIEIVNRKYLHPRNIIAAFTEILAHQPTFTGIGFEFGLDVDSPFSFDPGAGSGQDVTLAMPPQIHAVDDGTPTGTTVEEQLTLTATDTYITTEPYVFFRYVWFDGILALSNVHWSASGSNAIITNASLISGTQVIGQYVIGLEE